MSSAFLKVPLYFSPNFDVYLDYCETQKFLEFYRLPLAYDSTTLKSQLIKKTYQRIQAVNIPVYTNIKRDSSNKNSGLHLIEFETNKTIRYVNSYNIEQVVPIETEILEGNGSQIKERNLGDFTHTSHTFFTRYCDE